MARFVFGTVAFLAVVTWINACALTGGATPKKLKTRELHTEILTTGTGFDFLLRPRNAKAMATPDFKQIEDIFRKMDSNVDGVVDASEWTSFSDDTSVREFVRLLDFADLDDNEAVSLDELLSALK